MTADAKVGLLLGLSFIVVIAFLVNGPTYFTNSDKSEVETAVPAPSGRSIVIDQAVADVSRGVAGVARVRRTRDAVVAEGREFALVALRDFAELDLFVLDLRVLLEPEEAERVVQDEVGVVVERVVRVVDARAPHQGTRGLGRLRRLPVLRHCPERVDGRLEPTLYSQ